MSADAPSEAPSDELIQKTQEVMEQILSKKNLVRDQLLAGNMNPQMYIPIRILINHDSLVKVSATPESVMAAADKSQKLGIDENRLMIRPLLKSKRNIIILRDIPEGTTEDEIRGIFGDAPHKDKLVSVKPEVNNTWFVKFDLDEGTQDVVLWLRSQKFKGNPCNAAIKSEHFLRSFFPLNLPGGMPMPQKGGMPGAMPGAMPMDGTYMMGPPGPPPGAKGGRGKGKGDMGGMQNGSWGGGWGGAKGGKGGKGKNAWGVQPPGYWQPWGVRKSAVPGEGNDMPVVVNQAANLSPDIFDNTGSMGTPTAKGDGKGKKAGKKGGEGADGSRWQKKDKRTESGDGPSAVSSPTGVGSRPYGYEKDFKKYSREEIEKIFSDMATIPNPEAFEGHREDFPVFLDEACKDLAPVTPSGSAS